MRFQRQLTFLLVLVAVIPVGVSGVTSAMLTWTALSAVTAARLGVNARNVAEFTDAYVTSATRDLRLSANALSLESLTNSERRSVLEFWFRQQERSNAVALVDAQGDTLVEPVYLDGTTPPHARNGHDLLTPGDVERFLFHIQLKAALEAGVAHSPPYHVAGRQHPLMAVAVAIPLGPNRMGVMAVELSLAPLLAQVQDAAAASQGAALVLDDAGRPFCTWASDVAPPVNWDKVPAALAQAAVTLDRLPGRVRLEWDGVDMEASLASLDKTPWTVVLLLDEKTATAPVLHMLLQTGFWLLVAVLCAVLAGAVLSQGLAGPVETLVRVARAFEKGLTHARVPPLAVPDLHRLGAAFNDMAEQVERRDEELRAFNAQLQQRVEARTADLKNAQEQLIQSQKLAAVGELGAGVAHEINNPLAGLLGTVQLMLLRAAPSDTHIPALQDMEKEALRIRDIVQSLMQLTPQRAAGETLLDVNQVLEAALGLLARPIVAQRIEVKKQLDPALPPVRGRVGDLQQALMALLSNAQHAMPEGGVLTLTTSVVDHKLVKISIEDTGKGIPKEIVDRIFEPLFTTRSASGAKGLGLALVHRVAVDLGARVQTENRPGEGCRFTLHIPVAREKLHLS